MELVIELKASTTLVEAEDMLDEQTDGFGEMIENIRLQPGEKS